MTEQKHAPGPWSYDPGLSGKSAFVVDIEGHMIAMLPHADPRGIENAKLIAASTDLADAARYALKTAMFTDPMHPAAVMLWAALRKAGVEVE